MTTIETGNSLHRSQRLLDALSHKVHQHLGMDFSGARQAELIKRLTGLAQARAHSDVDSWLTELAFADWNANRIQTLVPAFSVGETYFRRDADAFDWLVEHHLKPLLARRRGEGQRHLRLWSAACCTGEEAYGLLFLIDDLLGAERDGWTVELLGTDISEDFLAQARTGIYGRNAFRGDDDAYRQRYFEPHGSRWRVRAAWRGRIRFARFNLADGRQACPMPGADLVLCRNVLMYFSAARASSALRRLLAGMDQDGLLMLTSVEAGIATQAGLNGRLAGSNYALSKQAATVAQRSRIAQPRTTSRLNAVAPPAPRRPVSARTLQPKAAIPVPRENLEDRAGSKPADPLALAEQALAAGQPRTAREALRSYLESADLASALRHRACLLVARSWANEQNIEAAREYLQLALATGVNSPEAYWLQALLEQQCGNSQATLKALQKALYLNPGFILAYFLQARLFKAERRMPASRKALQVCRQLLTERNDDYLVPHSDGMSAAQLLRLCEQLQDEGTE
ncbi:CheR family methyltransferase [Pseudomonas lopnurensis]|uniref:CheR family methyltransferase n=1 Tax=Pseudomonas lopnurensis TaxID=1477517 RepID=UPI0018792C88|nr:CheR family methyltransferase [Pseudomonas lopnurensis]MBE7373912.1 hypothetical protein [Pseudomonas lopnurensis]